MIDYDAVEDDFQNQVNRYEAEMINHLMQAMSDGDVANCKLVYDWQICNVCRGNGGHSRRLGVISQEIIDDWDDEDLDYYMSGGYDQTCERCDGSGKVKELNLRSLPEDVLLWIAKYRDDSYNSAYMTRSERMMGA
jgi:hypothetical protein